MEHVRGLILVSATFLVAGCFGNHIGKLNVDLPTFDPQVAGKFAREFASCVERPGGICQNADKTETVAEKLNGLGDAVDKILAQPHLLLPCDGSTTLDQESRPVLESVSAARNLLSPTLPHAPDGRVPAPPKISEFVRLVKALH